MEDIMEKKQFLESGKIVNTHGIKGEVKIQPWADTPEDLLYFEETYLLSKKSRFLNYQTD